MTLKFLELWCLPQVTKVDGVKFLGQVREHAQSGRMLLQYVSLENTRESRHYHLSVSVLFRLELHELNDQNRRVHQFFAIFLDVSVLSYLRQELRQRCGQLEAQDAPRVFEQLNTKFFDVAFESRKKLVNFDDYRDGLSVGALQDQSEKPGLDLAECRRLLVFFHVESHFCHIGRGHFNVRLWVRVTTAILVF